MVWNHGSTPRKELQNVAERNAKILEFRKLGMTLAQIGQKVDLDPSQVHRIIKKALEDIPKEAADELRTLELERLDTALRGIMPKVAKGDAQAVNAFIKIADHRAKLTGLYNIETGNEDMTLALQQFQMLVDAIHGTADEDDQPGDH